MSQCSFGALLQEKNYLYFRIRQLQTTSIWQTADRITKYLARFLWIRRFVKVFFFVVQLIEQSIVVIILTSTAILVLPLWLLSTLLEWLCNRFRYRRADRIFFADVTETGHMIFWSYSGNLPLSDASYFYGQLCSLAKENQTVVGVLLKKKAHLFAQNLTQLDTHLFTVSPSYFFHLRKKLNKANRKFGVFIYE